MKPEIISRLHGQFEAFAQKDDGVEFWRARDLQGLLGYTEWRNFLRVIERAKTACQNAAQQVDDHFVESNKMVEVGSGSQREVLDVALTRYACYLIAQNGDPAKDQIAFAQTYFAVQTRKQELIEQRLNEVERMLAREKLTSSEKQLSGVIFERVGDDHSFARIRSKGDQALFGGLTTQDMKKRLKVPASRPLADFLPTITIKAKDFANEITNFNIKRDSLGSEATITKEHVKNNRDVRDLLTERGITPELLPGCRRYQETRKTRRIGEKETHQRIRQAPAQGAAIAVIAPRPGAVFDALVGRGPTLQSKTDKVMQPAAETVAELARVIRNFQLLVD
jgi:DNA-damage-inducible protein D